MNFSAKKWRVERTNTMACRRDNLAFITRIIAPLSRKFPTTIINHKSEFEIGEDSSMRGQALQWGVSSITGL